MAIAGFASSLGCESQSQSSADTILDNEAIVEIKPFADLQAENQKLRKELQLAQDASQKWQQLHTELHSACVSRLINRAS